MIIEYKCEICRTVYDTAEGALECEATGKYKPGEELIKGIIWEYNHHDYVGIFTIATDTVFHGNGHLGDLSWWACRSPQYPGDSLGQERCGGSLYRKGEYEQWKKTHILTKEKVGSPEYERMVQFLKSQGITPSYYNEEGERIIIEP